MSKATRFQIEPGGFLRGRLRVPGDKSISHRSVMLGALSDGKTEVSGLLEGEDVLATISAFESMGVSMTGPKDGQLTIEGAGIDGLNPPKAALDMGNSGTAMRLMSGILAGQKFDSVLVGDDSLSKRPMKRVTDPLNSMGANIETAENGCPPLKVRGGQSLKGIHYDMPVASAQVKSAVMLAGLFAEGNTSVTEPAPTRDHTERMLEGFGYSVEKSGATVAVTGGGRLHACNVDVPGDISSAAFFLVGASIAKDSDLLLEHVGMNPTRIGVLNILKAMGARIDIENERVVGGEPVADLRVRSSELTGIEIPQDQVPLAIDEFPVIFVAAANASGTTVLKGAEELRVKESDRIAVMATGLKNLGVDVEETPDGIIIQGGIYSGGEVDSHGDHRIAMAFAMAALKASEDIHVRDCENVATSFPNFASLARDAGLRIQVHNS